MIDFMEMERNVEHSKFGTRVGGFFSEFWAFAAKGNAIQLAIGVVLGASFGAIVTALVNDIITPFITLATHNVDFASWGYTLRPVETMNGTTTPALIVGYGPLLQAVINFLIVGLSIFLIFKLFQGVAKRFQHQEAEKPVEPAVSTEEKLLSEIRDLLKEQTQQRRSGH
jgi:large conductance mechanosensitive channel